MGQLDDLKPTTKNRLIDLVEEAGVDVTDWGNFERGPKWAAANPKYCYEWSFISQGKLVILNLWHSALQEMDDKVTWSNNVRQWFSDPSVRKAKSIWLRRAANFDRAIQEAARTTLPIRAIINDGRMRDAMDPKGKPSSVQRRILDPLPWAIESYDQKTGKCILRRGVIAGNSIDQFDVPREAGEVTRVNVQTTVFVRDGSLRAAALQRADGKCELCLQPGFTTAEGKVFLETHHVIPLSEGGTDSADNVVAICPNHHREAHYGSRAAIIRKTLLARLQTLSKERSKRRTADASG